MNNKKLSTIVNDFRELKASKEKYTNDEYVNELEKIKHSLLQMINNPTTISKSDEDYLKAFLISLSIGY